MEKTQKDYVQDEIRQHFYRLKHEQCERTPIDAKKLRNNLIPKVKKQIKLSYNIGPTLFYKWADEVNQTEFQNEFELIHTSKRKERSRVVYQSMPPSTTTSSPEGMLMATTPNNEFKYREAASMNFMEDDMFFKRKSMVTSEIIESLPTTENISKEMYMKLYHRYQTMKTDYESDIQRWETLREHQKHRMDSMNEEIKRLRKEFYNFQNQDAAEEESQRRLKRTRVEKHPEIMNFQPQKGIVSQPLSIDFFIANFNEEGKWSCIVHDQTLNMMNSYPLNKDCIREGNLTLPLGTYDEQKTLTIHFEDESIPLQHVYRKTKPITIHVENTSLPTNQLELDLTMLSNLLDEEIMDITSSPLMMDDDENNNNSSFNRQQSSPFDGYREDKSGNHHQDRCKTQSQGRQPRASQPKRTGDDDDKEASAAAAYPREPRGRGDVTLAPSREILHGLERRWGDLPSQRLLVDGRPSTSHGNNQLVLRPIQFDERGNMVVSRGQRSFVWVDQTNEFVPSPQPLAPSQANTTTTRPPEGERGLVQLQQGESLRGFSLFDEEVVATPPVSIGSMVAQPTSSRQQQSSQQSFNQQQQQVVMDYQDFQQNRSQQEEEQVDQHVIMEYQQDFHQNRSQQQQQFMQQSSTEENNEYVLQRQTQIEQALRHYRRQENRDDAVAIVVSIDEYTNYMPLDSTTSDANNIASVLQSQLGYSVIQCNGVNKSAVQHALSKAKGAKELIFYFSGHAKPNQLVLGNSELFAYQELIECLPTTCEKVLLMLDACYSGSIQSIDVRSHPNMTIHALTSSTSHQRSIEQHDAGLFTKEVCKALQQLSDPTTDAIIETIQDRVITTSLSLSGVSQQPQLYKFMGDTNLSLL